MKVIYFLFTQFNCNNCKLTFVSAKTEFMNCIAISKIIPIFHFYCKNKVRQRGHVGFYDAATFLWRY